VNFAEPTIVNNLITKKPCGLRRWFSLGASFGSTLLLVNNTIADNYSPFGSGIFIDAFDYGSAYHYKNVVAKTDQTALFCSGSGPSSTKSNNVYPPLGVAYFSCFDLTGTDGNIFSDPLFVPSRPTREPPNHVGTNSGREMKECTWLKSVLVAQLNFQEWTPGGHLRHSSYVGRRGDKDAQKIVRESVFTLAEFLAFSRGS
jgi:hypothetical protein